MDFDLFCLRKGPKCEPTPKSASKCADFAPFFDTFYFDVDNAGKDCGGGSNSIRMVRKTTGRLSFMGSLACFSRVFSQECLPNNGTGCSECGEGLRDRQG